jgi:hypothetical protein
MVLILLLPAGYVGTATAYGNASIQALIADPLSLLALRSLGGRGAGALVQSKVAYASTDTPPGDFLGLIREPDLPSGGKGFSPVPPLAPELVSDVPPSFDVMSLLSPPGFDEAPGWSFSPGGFGGSEINDFAIGGGGFTPSVPGVPSRPPAAPPIVVQPSAPSSVPEPGTWLMIVAGFLAVGSALRSRYRSEAPSRAETIGPLPIDKR